MGEEEGKGGPGLANEKVAPWHCSCREPALPPKTVTVGYLSCPGCRAVPLSGGVAVGRFGRGSSKAPRSWLFSHGILPSYASGKALVEPRREDSRSGEGERARSLARSAPRGERSWHPLGKGLKSARRPLGTGAAPWLFYFLFSHRISVVFDVGTLWVLFFSLLFWLRERRRREKNETGRNNFRRWITRLVRR